ncbi:MAG: hypothetical protein H6925_03925 [Holosporaceae bacterium]|nr:MAG: hypothetical protein H6925_03925 [Holosporaceae bacterium]
MKHLKLMMGASLLALGLQAQASDFNGHILGLRAGGSFQLAAHEATTTGPGITVKDKVGVAGPQGLLGVDYTWKTGMWSPDLDWGVVASADWMLGDAKTKVNSAGTSSYYSVKQDNRFSLGAKFGVCTSDKVYPFVKVGAVAGEWSTAVRTQNGAIKTTDWMYGATVGMGVDFSVHAGGSIGFVTELDWYASKTHNLRLASGAASYSKVEVKPYTANVAVTYKYKIA